MVPIAVRRAQRSDVPDVARIHLAAIREICAADYPPAQIAAWTAPRHETHYEDAMLEHPFLVAEIAERVVGFGAVHLPSVEVRALYVDPAHLRRGIATALLTELEAIARSAGLTELQLDASLTAQPFYAHANYLAVGPSQHRLSGGSLLECVHMHKRLGPAPA